MKTKVFLQLVLVVVVLGLVGCETTRSKKGSYGKKTNTWDRKRSFTDTADASTPQWWYARRDYDPNYMHWGKMRHLDGNSKEEKFILLNEDQCRAPHRSSGGASSDNHREYQFFGYFMADRGYEPASDELCPVFVLQKWTPLGAPMSGQETASNLPPPPVPEVDEPVALPQPAQVVQASPPPAAKPKAKATNAVVKAKAKTVAKPAAKPVAKPVVKKTVPAPVAQ